MVDLKKRMADAKTFNPAGGAPARQSLKAQGVGRSSSFRGQGISPDYGRGRPQPERSPSYKTPSGSGEKFAREQSAYDRQVRYDRERRGAADKLSEIGARGQIQRDITGMQQRGQSQRQQTGFVQALQEQQNRIRQQNQLQQNRFGQEREIQQARIGQLNQAQQARFGQESMLDQLKAEREARQMALDYRTAGGSEAGAAAIGNQGFGMDYGAVNPVETAPKTGTYRFFQDDMDKWYSGHTGTGVTTPLNIGQLLNK